jgi:hypothetical protein
MIPPVPSAVSTPLRRLEFPWGWCVGTLVGGGSMRHALLPTLAGGVLVRFDTGSEGTAVNVLETAALSLVDALPPRAIEVHVIDFSIRKRFQHLAALAPLRQYRIYDNAQAAARALEEFESLARFRHHELLDNATPTLSDYNRQHRGCEPYRLLLLNLNDFPGGDRPQRERLLTLLNAAFDAGIYLLAYVNNDFLTSPASDQKDPPPPLCTLLAGIYPQVFLTAAEEGGVARFEIVPDRPGRSLLAVAAARGLSLVPPQVDLAALIAHRQALAASNEGQFRDFLGVPVGETLDGRSEVLFSLGAKSNCNHAFLLGISGSGKTTLLNNLIVGIAERYTSEEVRLFLMDYKDGVEFQVFARHPNCEKIFLDNRAVEAASQLLESFRGAIDERGQLFRALSVRDIDNYNAQAVGRLPRLLLIVDEVQCLLTEDAAGRRFNALLKDVVKRGRAFGVHILLATQTLINANLDRDVMSQITLRIAYKLNNDTDCDKIFSYRNTTPRRLDNFEFIYNADSGHPEANVRARALPPPAIAERIAAVLARLPAALRLQPEIIVREWAERTAPASATAPPVSAIPPASGWFADPADPERVARNRRNEDILATFLARQAAAQSARDPATDNPTETGPDDTLPA